MMLVISLLYHMAFHLIALRILPQAATILGTKVQSMILITCHKTAKPNALNNLNDWFIFNRCTTAS